MTILKAEINHHMKEYGKEKSHLEPQRTYAV